MTYIPKKKEDEIIKLNNDVFLPQLEEEKIK